MRERVQRPAGPSLSLSLFSLLSFLTKRGLEDAARRLHGSDARLVADVKPHQIQGRVFPHGQAWAAGEGGEVVGDLRRKKRG